MPERYQPSIHHDLNLKANAMFTIILTTVLLLVFGANELKRHKDQ